MSVSEMAYHALFSDATASRDPYASSTESQLYDGIDRAHSSIFPATVDEAEAEAMLAECTNVVTSAIQVPLCDAWCTLHVPVSTSVLMLGCHVVHATPCPPLPRCG